MPSHHSSSYCSYFRSRVTLWWTVLAFSFTFIIVSLFFSAFLLRSPISYNNSYSNHHHHHNNNDNNKAFANLLREEAIIIRPTPIISNIIHHAHDYRVLLPLPPLPSKEEEEEKEEKIIEEEEEKNLEGKKKEVEEEEEEERKYIEEKKIEEEEEEEKYIEEEEEENKKRFEEENKKKGEKIEEEEEVEENVGIIQDVVIFPDNVLLLLLKMMPSSPPLPPLLLSQLECVYEVGLESGSASPSPPLPLRRTRPVISVDHKDGKEYAPANAYIVKCPHVYVSPSLRNSSYLTLGFRGSGQPQHGEGSLFSKVAYAEHHSWRRLAYESLSLPGSVLLFVKARNFRRLKVHDASELECVYGGKVRTEVLMAAQEVVRCKRPPLELEKALVGEKISIWDKNRSVLLPSVARFSDVATSSSLSLPKDSQWADKTRSTLVPSLAQFSDVATFSLPSPKGNRKRKKVLAREKVKLQGKSRSTVEPSITPFSSAATSLSSPKGNHNLNPNPNPNRKLKPKPYLVCVCSMIWNQARFLPEWITYHSALGVQRWFLYDNNSNDTTAEVVAGLLAAGFHVTRHMWPWVKTQEAGFSHCAAMVVRECEWAMFIDVDEFVYPLSYVASRHGEPYSLAMHHVIKESQVGIVDDGDKKPPHQLAVVGEIRMDCHNFGPSGHTQHPVEMGGVTVAYTCRLLQPERHKSIVRLDALHPNLLNVVHHFNLKPGFVSVMLPRSSVVINHYKYQVWDVFKQKFERRVATYIADWKEKQDEESRDRTPGLGTQPIQPLDWPTHFCELNDTGLHDFVLSAFSNPHTHHLPWHHQQL